jgi:hypothetical protein
VSDLSSFISDRGINQGDVKAMVREGRRQDGEGKSIGRGIVCAEI